MENKSRRKFLREVGLTIGAIAIGKDITEASPPFQKKDVPVRKKDDILKGVIDFRYAPRQWQSTYCFPDDPRKSIVSKFGELLYGHKGLDTPYDAFPHIVSFDVKDAKGKEWLSQSLESPEIPIITTRYSWNDVTMESITFASNTPEEGRVDNVLLTFRGKSNTPTKISPEIHITSSSRFDTTGSSNSASRRNEIGIVTMKGESGDTPFLIVDSPLDADHDDNLYRLELKEEQVSDVQSAVYFIRLPQEGQAPERIAPGLSASDALLASVRTFWQGWKAASEKVDWSLWGAYQQFLVASARNIVQSREVRNGKPVMQVGPTVYRGFWVVDGHFMSEAARYLGRDTDAETTLRAIWDLQDEKGAITASAGSTHYKDTAVAIYSLVRHAELTQNYDLLNELYPDAYKAMVYLRNLRDAAATESTPNGMYSLVAGGFGDSGLRGTPRAEITSTIWTLIALKYLLEVSDRLGLYKASEIREFYGQLRASFIAMSRKEMVQHPKGFRYLPMLLKDDPLWKDPDPTRRPKPQSAQIYMSHAIYPGMLFLSNDPMVKGHLELMQAIVAEDIPAETGWLNDRSVWAYNAAVVAQAFLYAGQPEVARRNFVGFLNHASPLYAWREEQPLKDSGLTAYVGDMPHNWASAECIRYLRHMLVLEDQKILRLLDGLSEVDANEKQALKVASTPTRWGRVTLAHERVDDKHWVTRFKREDFDEKTMPPLVSIELPRSLPGKLRFDKAVGTSAIKNGPRVIIDGKATAWEAHWINPFKR